MLAGDLPVVLLNDVDTVVRYDSATKDEVKSLEDGFIVFLSAIQWWVEVNTGQTWAPVGVMGIVSG